MWIEEIIFIHLGIEWEFEDFFGFCVDLGDVYPGMGLLEDYPFSIREAQTFRSATETLAKIASETQRHVVIAPEMGLNLQELMRLVGFNPDMRSLLEQRAKPMLFVLGFFLSALPGQKPQVAVATTVDGLNAALQVPKSTS